MAFFEYRQNNSGGSFDAPNLTVIVEAPDAEIADVIAQRHGVYFDGCEKGIDCDCCGDRWSRAYGDGKPVPSLYGEPIEAADKSPIISMYAGLQHLVVFADGSTKEYPAA